jgi:hypothetical protein
MEHRKRNNKRKQLQTVKQKAKMNAFISMSETRDKNNSVAIVTIHKMHGKTKGTLQTADLES